MKSTNPTWLAQYEEDDEVIFRIGRDEDLLIAEWTGLVRLTAKRDGSAHTVERLTTESPEAVAKIERGGVMLLLRHLNGKLALHGGAIASNDSAKAAILIGRARKGKSTLVAALCRSGFGLLADDAVAMDFDAARNRFVVSGSERIHWLDQQAADAVECALHQPTQIFDASTIRKYAVPAQQLSERGDVVAFIELEFVAAGQPRLIPLKPGEAMAALIPQVVRFVLDEPKVTRSEMDDLARLVDRVPVYRLERPHTLQLLPNTCDLVASLLR